MSRTARIPAAAQRLSRASGILAACVLFDSAVEHYRGTFHNKAMMVPMLSATLGGLAAAHGAGKSARRSNMRRSAHWLAFVAGIVGTAFHAYNIQKRVGGLSWQNLFYGAPFGAPAALSLSGLLGIAAERLRAPGSGRRAHLLGTAAGRALAGVTCVGLAGAVAEVGLLHLRGAYHNPAMYLPVSIPPVAALSLACGTVGQSKRMRSLARLSLRLTALLGAVGTALHGFGVSRAMGGWRNWRQNLLNGPPIPAPPSFTALAAVGLVALDLGEWRDD